jgi:hypothetical protein
LERAVLDLLDDDSGLDCGATFRLASAAGTTAAAVAGSDQLNAL